jgi:hypothetical protein
MVSCIAAQVNRSAVTAGNPAAVRERDLLGEPAEVKGMRAQ